MVRNRQRKTTIGMTSSEKMKEAVNSVIKDGTKVLAAAKQFNIPRQTLERYVKQAKAAANPDEIVYCSKYKSRLIFTETEGNLLMDYACEVANILFGLSTKALRYLAFDFDVANNVSVPPNWTTNQMAGLDWCQGFLKRHRNLSLRVPQPTSLGRATGFNRTNWQLFFEKLRVIYTRHHYGPEDIYNLDETGVTTVHTPTKIIAPKGQKQVGRCTSGERGQLVTFVGCVSALGNAIPPVLVFPRVRFKESFLHGAPAQTMGLVHPSGWITEDNFYCVMQHFIKFSNASKEHPVLLIYDNHDSHISVKTIDLAKQNGVTILTLPPHCSHKLQPLDRTVYGPFKRFYNAACDNFMVMNPGKTITIHDIAGLVGKAYPLAFTLRNIVSGFHCTGIWPLNPDIFSDEDFLGCFVTDRPTPIGGAADSQGSAGTGNTPLGEDSENHTITAVDKMDADETDTNNTSTTPSVSLPVICSASNSSRLLVSPKEIQPLPKAATRKTATQRGRKRGRTRILTDTPEKMELLECKNKKNKNKQNSQTKVVNKANCKHVKRRLHAESSSSDSEGCAVLPMSDSDDNISFRDEDELSMEGEPQENDYIIVNVATSGKEITFRHFVGRIDSINKSENTAVVSYLQTLSKFDRHFLLPIGAETGEISLTDIVCKLPKPAAVGGTKRTNSMLVFPIDMNPYNVH